MTLLSTARRCADVARIDAEAVDRDATFPWEGVAALRDEGLLGADTAAAAPIGELATCVATLATACPSTAMIWATHLSLMEVLDRHAPPDLLSDLIAQTGIEQPLVAGITSEEGRGGDVRRSSAAFEPVEPEFLRVHKRATVASYVDCADMVIVTARRSADAAATDQVAALVAASRAKVSCRVSDPLGMRGTQTGQAELEADFHCSQLLGDPFAKIATETLLPASHILLAACWVGIAQSAVEIARRDVRSSARSDRKDDAERDMLRRHSLASTRRSVRIADTLLQDACARYESGTDSAALYNDLKLAVSRMTVETVTSALEIVGARGYVDSSSETFLGRHVRDVLSSLVMVSNSRIEVAQAWFALRGAGA